MFRSADDRRRYQRSYYKERPRSRRLRAAACDRWRKSRRRRIFERDGYRCFYCGRVLPDKQLHLDHKVPRSKGGSNKDDNLLTACGDCNRRRYNKPTCSKCRTWAKPQRLDDTTLRCNACGGINTFPPDTPAYDPSVEPGWVTETDEDVNDESQGE